MIRNIKLINHDKDNSIKRHNLDKHYDITDETYYNRPFSFTQLWPSNSKPKPLWKTAAHYKGTPVPSGKNNGKYKTVMKPRKPQAGRVFRTRAWSAARQMEAPAHRDGRRAPRCSYPRRALRERAGFVGHVGQGEYRHG